MFHVEHLRFICAVAVVAIAAGGCAQTSETTAPANQKATAIKVFERAVPVNAPIKLDDIYFANSRCEAIDFTLQIVKQPSNGQAMVQPSSTTLERGKVRSGKPNADCMGRVIASKAIVYRPNKGYAGPDSFDARFTNSRDPSRQQTVRYQLTVQ